MEQIIQKSLNEWKLRLEKQVLMLEEDLKGVDMGSNEDVRVSELLGKKRAIIEGIEKEFERSVNRYEIKISG